MRIEKALAIVGPEQVRVRGFLLGCRGEPMRICSELLESLPPQCGGAALVVEGLDIESVDGIARSEDCAWSVDPVEIEGTLERGVLRVG